MSSPTHPTANGDPKPGASASRPITPTKLSGSAKVFTPSKNPPIPKSPKEYYCEQELVKGPECDVLVIKRGWRENTYYEENCSPDPEIEEEMYTEKLELIKKQVQINKMAREIEILTRTIEEVEINMAPVIARMDAAKNVKKEKAAIHESKKALIGDLQAASGLLNGAHHMSAAEILEARINRLKINKLESDMLESEIEVLKAQMVIETEQTAAKVEIAKLSDLKTQLHEKSADVVNLKDDYKKSNLAWILKFSAEESTLQSKNTKHVNGDTLLKVEHLSAENTALKEQNTALKDEIQTILEKSTATSDEFIAGLKHTIAAGAAQNLAQADEIETLKAIVSAGHAQSLAHASEFQALEASSRTQADNLQSLLEINRSQALNIKSLNTRNQTQDDEIRSLKAFITQAQKNMDTKAASMIKDLEGKIMGLEGKLQIMKPLYRIGRQVRYRNNYSVLRKKYEGQNVECNLDEYEEGYHARFGGHAVADSMMYHSHDGFDEMYPVGLWERNFEQLHYGITAQMVWDHRHEFAMLAEILDMASNMMAYGPEKNRVFRGISGGFIDSDGVVAADAGSDTDEYDADGKFALVDFGHAEFKKHFVKVISHILPYEKTLAITSNDEFNKDQDLVDAFNAMHAIASDVVEKNYIDRRQGVEDSWDHPWENSWMEWDGLVSDAIKLQMC